MLSGNLVCGPHANLLTCRNIGAQHLNLCPLCLRSETTTSQLGASSSNPPNKQLQCVTSFQVARVASTAATERRRWVGAKVQLLSLTLAWWLLCPQVVKQSNRECSPPLYEDQTWLTCRETDHLISGPLDLVIFELPTTQLIIYFNQGAYHVAEHGQTM